VAAEASLFRCLRPALLLTFFGVIPGAFRLALLRAVFRALFRALLAFGRAFYALFIFAGVQRSATGKAPELSYQF